MLKEEQVLGRKKTTNSNLSSCSVTRYEIDNEKLRLTTCVANITKWQINVLFKKKKERQIFSRILSCYMHRRISSFHSALSSRLVTVTVSCINQAVFSFPRSVLSWWLYSWTASTFYPPHWICN